MKRNPNKLSKNKFKEIHDKSKRPTLKIGMLKCMAISGNQSKKDLELKLKRASGTISDTIDEMVDVKNPENGYIRHANNPCGDDKRRTVGRPHDYFGLTQKGIEFLIKRNELAIDEFWKLIFNTFDTRFQYRNSNENLIEWINPKIEIKSTLSYYEKTVLRSSRVHALPLNASRLLSNFKLIDGSKQVYYDSLYPILEILGTSEKLDYDTLQEFIEKQKIETNGNVLIELYNQGFIIYWHSRKGIECSLSQLGLMLLFYLIYRKLTQSKRELSDSEKDMKSFNMAMDRLNEEHRQFLQLAKDVDAEQDLEKKKVKLNLLLEQYDIAQNKNVILLRKIVSKNEYLFPRILGKWNDLSKMMDDTQLLEILIMLYFKPNEDYPLRENDEESLRLLSSQSAMEHVHRFHTRKFYYHGLMILQQWIDENQCTVPVISPLGFIQPQVVLALSYNYNFASLKHDPQEFKIKYKKIIIIKEPLLQLARLGKIIMISPDDFFGEFDFDSSEDYLNSDETKAIDNVISFQFFTVIRSWYPVVWNESVKNDSNHNSIDRLEKWYEDWLDTINKFESNQKEQIEKISVTVK